MPNDQRVRRGKKRITCGRILLAGAFECRVGRWNHGGGEGGKEKKKKGEGGALAGYDFLFGAVLGSGQIEGGKRKKKRGEGVSSSASSLCSRNSYRCWEKGKGQNAVASYQGKNPLILLKRKKKKRQKES